MFGLRAAERVDTAKMFTPISGRILKLNNIFTSIRYMKAEQLKCTLHTNETCVKWSQPYQ